jgi:hypothetical protein
MKHFLIFFQIIFILIHLYPEIHYKYRVRLSFLKNKNLKKII